MALHETLQESLRRKPGTWLVTGAAGFIGSHLTASLLALGQRVIGLDNLSTGSRGNLAQVRDAVGDAAWRNFSFVEGDIRSLDTCRQACRGVDRVLHEAALGSVPRSLEDPVFTEMNNVVGFLNMLVAAHGAGVSRFVYAGSSAAYGDEVSSPNVESRIGQPLSPYGLTKLVDELYASLFARCYGLPSIGLRYFNVFGPRQDPAGPYAAVIPAWINAMIAGERAYINGDGETTRDFCYVGNVVDANLLAATVENPAAVNQVYNIAMGGRTTLNELFELIRSQLEPRFQHLRGITPDYRDFRPGDVPFSQADIGKAERLLGYVPGWRIGQGLARTIDWYAENLGAKTPLHALA